MILIGQYASPFVRRAAIATRLYGITIERRPWSTLADAEQIAAYNPLLGSPRRRSTVARFPSEA
jgi:hypothetical protein